MSQSKLEATLLLHIRAARLPDPVSEFRFHPTRQWRADFAWPARKLLVEVEGGTFMQGRHSRGAGMREDAEKYNAAVLLGYRLLRVTGDMVTDGSALDVVERALKE